MKAMTKSSLAVVLALVPAIADLHAGQATPRQQPGAEMTVYAPEQHELYDGQFRLSAGRVYMVGGLNDPAGWNHIDNDASTVHAVEGTVEIDINEITNTGQFIARLTVPEGDLVVELDRFNEFNPCQDGGWPRSSTSTEIPGVATPTGPRPSCTLRAGGLDMRH